MRKADNLPPSCAVVTISENLNFLEPSGPLQAWNGTALPFTVQIVLRAPDDGWRLHPKHVEQFTDINKLDIVASCWIITAIYYTMHGPVNIKFMILVT